MALLDDEVKLLALELDSVQCDHLEIPLRHEVLSADLSVHIVAGGEVDDEDVAIESAADNYEAAGTLLSDNVALAQSCVLFWSDDFQQFLFVNRDTLDERIFGVTVSTQLAEIDQIEH